MMRFFVNEVRTQSIVGRNNQNIIKEYFGDNLSMVLRTYAKSIYSIPEVRTAIETMADIISTVPIYHKVENKDGTADYIDDDISFVLNLKPNAVISFGELL